MEKIISKESHEEFQKMAEEGSPLEHSILRIVLSLESRPDEAKILASIFESLGEGILVADKEGKILLVNPMAHRILGINDSESVYDHWGKDYSLYQPDKTTPIPTEELPLSKAMRGIETDEVEIFINHSKADKQLFVSATGRPLRDHKCDIIGGVVIFRDITDQKETQEALHEVMESMEDLVKARTAELLKMNGQLKRELDELKEELESWQSNSDDLDNRL